MIMWLGRAYQLICSFIDSAAGYFVPRQDAAQRAEAGEVSARGFGGDLPEAASECQHTASLTLNALLMTCAKRNLICRHDGFLLSSSTQWA